MHWLLCVLILIALVVVILAWKDHREKPRLWIAVLIIVIVIVVPCLQRVFDLAGAAGSH